MNMEYIIKLENGQILSTNIKNEIIFNELLKCQSDCERTFCKSFNKYRRQGQIIFNGFSIFIVTYDDALTNRIFKNQLEGISIFGKFLEIELLTAKNFEWQKTRRLKHNLINHNSNILLELYKLVPQDEFRNGINHIDLIKEKLQKDLRKAAFAYLKVLKSSSLMKAEFEVYDMLDSDHPYLDFTEHQIHKVLMLTLYPFWLDLAEQKVSLKIQSFYEKVVFDYRSISVALSHVFDNIVKYVMAHSEINIFFDMKNDYIQISIEMISLKVENEEIEQIFKESESGKWAKELELNGDGVGMFMVKKLIEYNNGTIHFIADFNKKGIIHYNGIPYENNKIIIYLKKNQIQK